MIRSMTGFGESEVALDAGVLRVSIKTVNHRYLNTSVRTPPGFDRFEHEVPKWLKAFLKRGHATVAVSLERGGEEGDEPLPELDHVRADRYVALLRELQERHGLEAPLDAHALLRMPEVLRTPDAGRGAREIDPEVFRRALAEAARGVVRLREAEGGRLQGDLEERLRTLEEELERVGVRAPQRLLSERDRLRGQIRELVESEDVDEERLGREIAYLAERWDINEEIVRLSSHIELFRETLATESEEPVGRRLAFVVQEMHREVNTIGSKSNDVEITRATVAMKEAIEKLREQVENVE
jgi:uncharacterized protein (TIGR00255 family)